MTQPDLQLDDLKRLAERDEPVRARVVAELPTEVASGALAEMEEAEHPGVIGKEVLVGGVNGLANGVVVALVAAFLGDNVTLGIVVLLAMWGNLLVAGFAGAFIPILLERLGVDPAIASSIFVTTFTDVCGFLLLLGLGTALLL